MSKLIHIANDDHDTRSIKDKEIDRWEIQYAGCIIIRSSYASEEELDDAWEKFNQMPFDLQLVADDEALRLFGITNGKMYRRLKKVYLRRDIDNSELIPLAYTPKDAIIEAQGLEKNKYAYDYMRSTGYPLITDVDSMDELNKQWYKWCNTPKDIRDKADGMSTTIFGMNNEEHYQSELNKLLRQDIDDTGYDEIDNVVGESSALTYLVSCIDCITESDNVILAAKKAKNILLEYDSYSMVEQDVTKYILTRFNSILSESLFPQIHSNYFPYYSPNMIDMLGTYNPSNPNTQYLPNKLIPSEIWKSNYKAKYYGLKSYPVFSNWQEAVHTLMNRLSLTEDEEERKVYKECILGFGWNPEVEFTRENMIKASDNNKNHILNEVGYKFINMKDGFYQSQYPIVTPNGLYIIFFKGGNNNLDKPNTFVSFDFNLKKLIPIRNGYPYRIMDYTEASMGFTDLSIYFVPMDEYLCNKINKASEYIYNNSLRFGYNFLNQICVQLNTQCPAVENEKLFVTYLINMLIQIAHSNLASPGSISLTPLLSIYKDKHTVYKVFEDKLYKLIPDEVLNKVKAINSITDIPVKEDTYLKEYPNIKAVLYADAIKDNEEFVIKESMDNIGEYRIILKDLENMFMNY